MRCGGRNTRHGGGTGGSFWFYSNKQVSMGPTPQWEPTIRDWEEQGKVSQGKWHLNGALKVRWDLTGEMRKQRLGRAGWSKATARGQGVGTGGELGVRRLNVGLGGEGGCLIRHRVEDGEEDEQAGQGALGMERRGSIRTARMLGWTRGPTGCAKHQVSGIILGFSWGGWGPEERQVWGQEGAFRWAASERDASEPFR